MNQEPNFDFTDTLEDGGNTLKSRWSSLETPIQIGIIAGLAITLIAFARYVIPAMVAAMGIGLVFAILFVPYWLPSIIAFFRGHPNKFVISLVNFFLGWTFVGWWVSLFWALSSTNTGNQNVVVNVSNTANAGGAVVGGYPQPMPGQIAPQPMAGQLPPPQQQPMPGQLPPQQQPMPGQLPPQAAPPAAGGTNPQYQAGDVVNGHRFDGAVWHPVELPQQQTPPPPPPPAT